MANLNLEGFSEKYKKIAPMECALELIDKVSPCIAISEKENLKKFKEWLDSDRSKRVTFVESSKTFENQVEDDKVFLIPTDDEAIKPIKVIFEGE